MFRLAYVLLATNVYNLYMPYMYNSKHLYMENQCNVYIHLIKSEIHGCQINTKLCPQTIHTYIICNELKIYCLHFFSELNPVSWFVEFYLLS